MRYQNNLTDLHENAYFRVIECFEVLRLIGISESNTWVGRSRMFGNVYERRILRPGDQVHDLFGGVFVLLGEAVFRARMKLSEKHPFEKTYGPPGEELWPVEKLERIAPEDVLRPRGGYHRDVPKMAPGEFVGRGIDSILRGAR